MTQTEIIQENYTFPNLTVRVEDALTQAGYGSGQIPWADLAALDQFHVRGLAATQELAEGLGLTGQETVLDVGSGLGGPARYLASAYDCAVTGIELQPDFVEVATLLSERSGLSGKSRFVAGDALKMPFPDASFDHAWTQHVAMNIEDKAGLYAEVARVLKPGGRFAVYDVVTGVAAPVLYPTPWARDETISFLVSAAALHEALRAAGFRQVSTVDTTAAALSWFQELQQAAPQAAGGPNPLSLGGIGGPGIREAIGNFARNVQEGRVRLMQVVVEREEIGGMA